MTHGQTHIRSKQQRAETIPCEVAGGGHGGGGGGGDDTVGGEGSLTCHHPTGPRGEECSNLPWPKSLYLRCLSSDVLVGPPVRDTWWPENETEVSKSPTNSGERDKLSQISIDSWKNKKIMGEVAFQFSLLGAAKPG